MTSPLHHRLLDMLRTRADRVAGGDLSELDPFECIVHAEAVSARVYARYNRTEVLALDVYVDDLPSDPELQPDIWRWVATRSGVMPFATLHIDRQDPPVLMVSHTLVAETVDDHQLDEVLDGLTFMARRSRARLAALVASAQEARSAADDAGRRTNAEHDAPSAPVEPRRATIDPPSSRADDAERDDFTVHTPSHRSTEQVLADLDQLVGLHPVKAEITALVRAQEVAGIRRQRGLAANTPSPHLVFVGNPGTGKTTVARLVGELYRSIGLLQSGHLVETDRAGLVAGYLGQTALKTKQVCERALGGVLFIDEAYSLVAERDSYGTEAIDTLLTFMENHRGEMAVVVAGYPVEMRRFIDSNPGLRSRFDLTVEFPDYSTDELMTMFDGLAVRHDYDLAPDARLAVQRTIAALPRRHGFGNGREVRKLFNEVTRRHAQLLAGTKPDTAILRTLTAEAVPAPVQRATERHPGYL